MLLYDLKNQDKNFSKCKKTKLYTINETKKIPLQNCTFLSIHSNITDIEVICADTDIITATLSGSLSIGATYQFSIQQCFESLIINIIFSSQMFIGDNLSLLITLPSFLFNAISLNTLSGNIKIGEGITVNSLYITSTSGDIFLSEQVQTNFLKIVSTSGNIISHADFRVLSINTISGKTNIFINATHHTLLDVISVKGNIKVKIQNFTKCLLFLYSKKDKQKLKYCPGSDKCMIEGSIKTTNGKISIKS